MNDYTIIILVSTCLVGIGLLSLLPENLNKTYKVVALITVNVVFLLSLVMWIIFDTRNPGPLFQFMIVVPWLYELNIFLAFGIDGISIFFVLLTTLIFPFCILASWELKESKLLMINLLLIEMFLILTFTSLDLFFFCLFFESLLIPMFFIILFWGTRERRIKALTYFFLYTLFGSIFLILALFLIYLDYSSTSLFTMMAQSMPSAKQNVVWLLLFIVFAIKIPMVPFHIWLPEAHVEAPTVGSVILAGLLLKLGGYGILRFLFMFNTARYYYQPFVITLCLISILFASIIALRQVDMKRIIAYSSIAHINFALLGYFSNTIYGMIGGTILMISHGIVSSALFLLVGVLYDRHHTRIIYYYGGLVQTMPLFSFFFFLFTISNFSFPGTSNFVGELLVLISLGYAAQKIVLVIAAFSTLFGLLYSILLFNRITFGNIKTQCIKVYYDLTRREFCILTPLLILNIWIGIAPNSIIDTAYVMHQHWLIDYIEPIYEELNPSIWVDAVQVEDYSLDEMDLIDEEIREYLKVIADCLENSIIVDMDLSDEGIKEFLTEVEEVMTAREKAEKAMHQKVLTPAEIFQKNFWRRK